MATTIDQAFIKQFESEVHVAYQRAGSKLRNTVRFKSNVNGTSTTFQKVGKGTAATKGRHGNVPTMSIDHTAVECTVADYYAADYVDKLKLVRVLLQPRAVMVTSRR